MGTRRGGDRKTESDAFEAANPFLTRVDTRIEVAPKEEDEGPKKKGPPEPFDIIVTEDGEVVESYVSVDRAGPSRTLTNGVETPIGSLDGVDEGHNGPPPREKLVLSEHGFGVAIKGEGPGGGNGLDTEDFALDDDEALQFFITPFGLAPAIEGFGEGEHYYPGGTDFGIDFTVLDGSGTVEIHLLEAFPFFKGPLDLEEAFVLGSATSGTVSGEGTTGSLDADPMMDYVFNAAFITVTGDLQIGVTGIDVTTNFEGMFLNL